MVANLIEYLYNGQYGVTTDRNGLYYMRARYYDQDIKRFINRDVVSGDITNSLSLNRYCYVQGNPVSLADPFGLCPDGNSTMQGLANSMMRTTDGMFSIADQVNDIYNSSSYFGHMLLSRIGTCWHGADIINEVWYAAERNYDAISTYGHAALDLAGIIWDGADVINALWYAAEGNYDMAVVSGICALPFVGSIVGGSAGMALKMIGHSMTFGMATEGTIEAVGRAVDAYQEGNLSWWNALDVGINVLGMGLAGRAAYSSGKQLASCVASSNAGKRISNNIRSFMADNRGCVDLDAFKSGSGSSTIDYKKVFFDKHPELEGKVVVHHSIEQQVLKRYPGLFTKEEINAYEMLRGIPKEVNSDIHLSKIRIEWNNFYKKVDAGEIPLTKDSFFNKAKEIDDLFGGKFNPPK